ncbi:Hypothetical protein Tpal_1049 [Trichococcus palustris]|uniref:Uncharacterized protein n=1 Tax=Trichococcus palustris TaxID=140314 RepID=A0A143YH42_9LACT|nr:Hypothetical protein Tpal_1049 [Trichococcus palustris]SFL00727.1 hypothetical protein SAMN04488076_11348 [Trichococcus palustris]
MLIFIFALLFQAAAKEKNRKTTFIQIHSRNEPEPTSFIIEDSPDMSTRQAFTQKAFSLQKNFIPEKYLKFHFF